MHFGARANPDRYDNIDYDYDNDNENGALVSRSRKEYLAANERK